MGRQKIHLRHDRTSNICMEKTAYIRVMQATLLPKKRRKSSLNALLSIKVPSGFSSNIKGIINMAEKKFQNLKSHECQVIMTQLLPVALRGLLPENVRLAIMKLCAFLNAIS